MTKRPIPPLGAVVLADELDDVACLTDEEVLAELKASGIDRSVSTRKIDAAIDLVEAEERRSRLVRARSQRLSHAHRNRLGAVQSRQLPLDELRAQIRGLQGQVAHREFGGETRDDLESLLADLLDVADESD